MPARKEVPTAVAADRGCPAICICLSFHSFFCCPPLPSSPLPPLSGCSPWQQAEKRLVFALWHTFFPSPAQDTAHDWSIAVALCVLLGLFLSLCACSRLCSCSCSRSRSRSLFSFILSFFHIFVLCFWATWHKAKRAQKRKTKKRNEKQKQKRRS